MTNLISQFVAARACGVPLIAVSTADQHATTISLAEASPDASEEPAIRWDFCNGFTHINTVGEAALKVMYENGNIKEPRMFIGKPADALGIIKLLPEESVVIKHNAHRYLDNPAIAQAVANLREPFK